MDTDGFDDSTEAIDRRLTDIENALDSWDIPCDILTVATLFTLALREAWKLADSPEEGRAVLNGWARIAANYPLGERLIRH